MAELDRKASSVFAGKVMRKDLVRKVKVGTNRFGKPLGSSTLTHVAVCGNISP